MESIKYGTQSSLLQGTIRCQLRNRGMCVLSSCHLRGLKERIILRICSLGSPPIKMRILNCAQKSWTTDPITAYVYSGQGFLLSLWFDYLFRTIIFSPSEQSEGWIHANAHSIHRENSNFELYVTTKQSRDWFQRTFFLFCISRLSSSTVTFSFIL